MHCLGKEEAKYHLVDKKNPYYFLNQEVISFMILLNAPKLKSSYAKQICKSLKPTQTILRLIFSQKKNLFSSRQFSDFETAWSDLFIKVRDYFQKLSPSSDCLTRQIPALKETEEQILYNSDLFSLYRILNRKKRASRIIKTLLDRSKDLFQNCSS